MFSLILIALAAAPTNKAPARPTLPSTAALFVVSTSNDEASANQLELRLLSALRDVSVPLVDFNALFPLPAPKSDPLAILAAAKAAFDDLDYEVAQKKFEEAIEAMNGAPQLATDKGLAEANLFLGILAVQTPGKAGAKKAEEAFSRALVFDPDVTLDSRLYGDSAKKAFDQALGKVKALPSGSLSIESTPAGAQVVVRGKSLGGTPLLNAISLPAGRHLVRLTRPGYQPAAAFAQISKTGGAVNVPLAVLPGAASARADATAIVSSGGANPAQMPGGVRPLAQTLKSRFLLLVASSGTAGSLTAWDAESGNRLSQVTVADTTSMIEAANRVKNFIDHPSAVVAPATAPVAKASPVGGTGVAAEVESTGDESPVYKKWWFWAAVGVVAVGAGTAVGMAAAAPPQLDVALAAP